MFLTDVISLASSHYLSTSSASSTPNFEPNLNMVDLPKLEGNNDNNKGEIHVAVNFVLYCIFNWAF